MKPEPMQRTELSEFPWQHIAKDLLEPLPSGDTLFVLVDYFSRWIEVKCIRSTTSDKIVQCMKDIFCKHGFPESIISDNGPQFISSTFRDYLQENGINHRRTTPLWTQANGEVERQNRSILKRLKVALAEG